MLLLSGAIECAAAVQGWCTERAQKSARIRGGSIRNDLGLKAA